MEIKNYDGITEKKDGSITSCSFNIHEALKNENPRNIFLNGQLYVEMICDSILVIYFGKDEGIKQNPISQFLKSRYIDFFSKIEFLKLLEKIGEKDNIKRRTNLIPSKLIGSLKAIAQVRNAFQHNLEHSEAMRQVIKGGSKFHLINKKLEDYKNIDDLIKDFKNEVENVYCDLHKILMEIPK